MTTLRARDRIAQVRLRPLSMSAVTGMSTAAAIRAIAAHVSSIGAASPSAKPSVAATALLAEATAGNRQPPRHWRSRRPRRSPERAVGQAHGGSEGRPPARPTVERSWSSESPSNWRRVQFCRARRPRRCRADHSTVGGSCRRVPDRAIVASLGVWAASARRHFQRVRRLGRRAPSKELRSGVARIDRRSSRRQRVGGRVLGW